MSVNIKSGNSIIIWPALAIVIGLGLWLRWRFIHSVQLYPDEFVSLLAIQMIGEKGLPLMPSGLFYEHGLLFSYLGSLAAWFGPARVAARYASLLCGTATLLLIFVVGWRWYTPATGLIATAGLAIAPTAIHWSGRARMYALLQLLVLLTAWLLFEGVSHNKAALRWAALAVFWLAVLAHFAAVALVPPLLLAALLLAWQQQTAALPVALRHLMRQKSVWFELLALVAIIIMAFLLKRAGQPKGIDPLDSSAAASGIMQVLTIYSDVSLNVLAGWQAINPFYLTLPALIFFPFALLAAFFALTPAAYLPAAKNSRQPSLYLASLLLATTLEMMLLVSSDRRDDKYLFMLLPALLLLGAAGMVQTGHLLRKFFSPLTPSPLPSILVVAFILALTWPAAQTLLANSGDDYDAAFAMVQQQWQAGDTIMTGTPAAAALYLNRSDFYSVQRQGGYDYRLLTRNGRTVDRWLASPAIRTEAELHHVLANNDVWLVLERWGLQREYFEPLFQQQLLAQTDLVGEAQGIFILRPKSNPQPLPPEPAHPVAANFDNLLALNGYSLQPEQGTAGQPLRLILYWQPLAPLPHDYTVFVHLRDAAGGNVAQADHRPLGSLYPTSLWPVGETIRESSELPLPENLTPGRYSLWVGLYLLESGERLSLQADSGGENAFLLGEVVIQ